MKKKKLYKFLTKGLKSKYDKQAWKIGEWKKAKGEPECCKNGFHASREIRQAFGYVQGSILAEVETRGESHITDDKEAWSEMRIVKAWKWEKKNSVAIAIFAAEEVINIFEKKYPNDNRPRKAIEAAKEWLRNPCKENRKAANAAAYAAYAAYVAAYAAAYAANAAYAAAKAAKAAYAAAKAAYAAYAANAANAAKVAITITKKINERFDEELKSLEVYEG